MNTFVKGKLILEDGTTFEGYSFGYNKNVSGEVIFNTGMVGYPETLTDPSYKGQILVLTNPLIGNYGIPSLTEKDKYGLLKNFESDKIHLQALVISSYSEKYSHWTAEHSLGEFLQYNKVPALFGIDTRALTKKIRNSGAMLGKIIITSNDISFYNPHNENLVQYVSRTNVTYIGNGKYDIIVVDCGVKNNILRKLLSYNDVRLIIVPWNYNIKNMILNENISGILLSNGPGNPVMVDSLINIVKWIIDKEIKIPMLGICLGNQIIGLASGAKINKMKFGHHSMNQPCIDNRNLKSYITSQNHGYAIDETTLSDKWLPLFKNINDNTNEGLIHKSLPYFSVQFHPEAKGGPMDTEFIFNEFYDMVRNGPRNINIINNVSTLLHPIKKILLLGSGGLSIGQAGEFDYSGSQTIKALKEENIYTILINPNIATVQTSYSMADQVYFHPVTAEYVEKIIKQELPDGILLQFGGQTALNCGIELYDSGILEKYNVKVLGTPIDAIKKTEDRQMFSNLLEEMGESFAPSQTATSVEESVNIANKLGYPVLIRCAFTLGGLGSGFVNNDEELRHLVKNALIKSKQVIIDKSLKGWKEIEYEIMRDCYDNCITVCNMENFDPLGIHTGDSIVVAPSQTLTNDEYYKLRETSIKVIRKLGIIGECNIQYALDPYSSKYCIIEVNARLSRSSALASKATGYPLAYVATKLCLPNHSLVNVYNSLTKVTSSFFEPSLDYCVIKFPKWDFGKFRFVSTKLDSAMKSVGEIMAIGRNFNEAFQKGFRMLFENLDGFTHIDHKLEIGELETLLTNPTDQRIKYLAKAFNLGYSVDKLYKLTCIDKWFLYQLENLFKIDKEIINYSKDNISKDLLLQSKKNGFSDLCLARLLSCSFNDIRKLRKINNIVPIVKQIDTMAAEYPVFTNYLYTTYSGIENDITFNKNGIIVLGSGSYRIGSSCEFDWCAVECLKTLKKLEKTSIMINYNPETVSTDYDECDRLYFEELSLERILDIYELENPEGIILSLGGQIPQTLAMKLQNSNIDINILGTQPKYIDMAENRYKFSKMLDTLNIQQPQWKNLTNIEDTIKFANTIGYPVMLRPSYVLSGSSMNIATNDEELRQYIKLNISNEHPIVCSKFITGAKEIEFDGVANNGKLLNYAISEHIENAGIHSGDSTMVLPAQKLYTETRRLIKIQAKKIAKELCINGPFNIQFMCINNDIKIIECNLRASRSMPFVCKTLHINFIEQATKAMLNMNVKEEPINLDDINYVCIKCPIFSFTRLMDVDPLLNIEMASTGEVAAFGKDRYEAYLYSLLATGFKLPKKNIFISIGSLDDKLEILECVQKLVKMGYVIYTTKGTGNFFKSYNINVNIVKKPDENTYSIIDMILNKEIDMIINISDKFQRIKSNGYKIRRTAIDNSIPLITNVKTANLFILALEKHSDKKIFPWNYYLKNSNRI